MSSPRFKVDPLSESFVRLIDIMFGLTLTQGFVIYRDVIVHPELSINVLNLILVYTTIILSWIYYHKSILHYPYNKSRWSRLRLFFDLLILVLYAYLVFVGQDLSGILIGLVVIFIIYGIDGIVRICEWRDSKVSNWWLSFSFAVIFSAELYAASLYADSYWILSLIALISIFSYRVIRSKLGYPSLLVVGVDVDGVLGEQVPPVLERLKHKKGLSLTKEAITEWDLQIDDTTISKEIEEALLDPNFVKKMPLVQGAPEALRQLYTKYHVVIVTSRPRETERETLNWLKEHFKYHEFINTREIGKNISGINVLIDDNLQNIESFASSEGFGLLFLQPWNRKIESSYLKDLMRTGKVIRCENWNDVLKVLLKIERALGQTL